MKRRDFLVMAAAFSATSLVTLAKPNSLLAKDFATSKQSQIQYSGEDGKIYKSEDMGETWESIVDFGGAIQIKKIHTQSNGTIIVKLRHAGHNFQLRSTDGLFWRL